MTARFYRDYGNGPVCPEADDHGHLYEIDNMYWCPVTQALFAIVRGGDVGEVVRNGHSPRGNAPAITSPAGGGIHG